MLDMLAFRRLLSFVVFVLIAEQEGSDIITFETLSPSWNEVLHAWTLNFNGRVKIPSKKNFLVAPEKVCTLNSCLYPRKGTIYMYNTSTFYCVGRCPREGEVRML